MWEWLVNISTWVENNSGQIQIIIALAALFFAYKAYLGLMIQLRHSSEQEEIANKQRAFELYIKIIHELGQTYSLSKQTITDYKNIIIDYELLIKELMGSNINKSEIERLSDIVRRLKEQEVRVKNSENTLKGILKKFENSKNQDVEYMQNLLAKTIPINSNLNRVSSTPNRMRVYLRKRRMNYF